MTVSTLLSGQDDLCEKGKNSVAGMSLLILFSKLPAVLMLLS